MGFGTTSWFSLSLGYKSVITNCWAVTDNVVFGHLHLFTFLCLHLTFTLTVSFSLNHLHHSRTQLHDWTDGVLLRIHCMLLSSSDWNHDFFHFVFPYMIFTRLDNLPWTIGSVAFFNNNAFVIQHKEPHKENISKTQSLLKVCASFPGLDYCLCDRKYIILIDRVILYSTLCINGLNISHREILHYVISNRKNASTCCQIKPSFYHLLFVTIH